MSTAAQPAPKPRASAKYGMLSPLEAALIDQIGESNDNVVAAVDRLTAKAPSPKLVAGVAVSMLASVLALVLFCVALVASSKGIDPRVAAEAATTVVSAVETVTTTAATHEAPEVTTTTGTAVTTTTPIVEEK